MDGVDPAPLVERKLEEPSASIREAQQPVRLGWRRREGLAGVRLHALREGDEEDHGRQGGTERARAPPEPKLERQRGGDDRRPARRQEEALELPHLPQRWQHRRERAEDPLEQGIPVGVEADRAAKAEEEEHECRKRGRARGEAEPCLAGRRLWPQGEPHPPGREGRPQEGPGRESRSVDSPRSGRRGSPRPPARRGAARAGAPRRDARGTGALRRAGAFGPSPRRRAPARPGPPRGGRTRCPGRSRPRKRPAPAATRAGRIRAGS